VGKLFEEIASTKKRLSGPKPRILEILQSLDKEDRKDLLDALNDHTISSSSISSAMEKRGYRLTVATINRYRRGELETTFDESI
jgi:hypothetical protein